jgi:trehalose-phosphatase
MKHSRPKYLFDCLGDVRGQLAKNNTVFVFLDLDGTLASITPTPTMTRLKPETRAALRVLAGDDRFGVTVVSGRELQDLKSIVKLTEITYAGNHGLEIAGPALEFLHDEAMERAGLIDKICDRLRSDLQSVNGAFVEFKRLSASVHYRLVARNEIDGIRATVDAAVAPFRDLVFLTEGKRVLELRPAVSWNKGSAVQWILDQTGQNQSATIYIGDDRTDEDAFRALQKGITVHVGKQSGKTSARYFLRSPGGVLALLEYLTLIERSSRVSRRIALSALRVGTS